MKQPLCEAMRDTSDQRAFRRYPVTLPVLVRPLLPEGGHGRWTRMATVLVTDISLSGLTFCCRTPHLPGSRLEMQIAFGAQTYLVEAVVRRGQFINLPGRRAWQCAVQFLRGDEAVRFVPRLARYLYALGARE